MASIIQGSANDNLRLIAGTGQSIVFTTDAEGSIDIATMATQGYVTSQINNLIDSAPGALDTLNEIAAALGDDSDFAGTVTTSLGLKANTADVYTQAEVDSALANKEDAFVTAPTSSVGQAGDLAGQIAFSSTHVYYCTADYTDGVADIWARVGLTLETW